MEKIHTYILTCTVKECAQYICLCINISLFIYLEYFSCANKYLVVFLFPLILHTISFPNNNCGDSSENLKPIQRKSKLICIILVEWGLTVHHLAMGMLSILQDNSKYITNKSALTKQENVSVWGKGKARPLLRDPRAQTAFQWKLSKMTGNN